MEKNYEHLRSVRLAEFQQDGIRFLGTFTLPERMARVNGVLCAISADGQILGQVDVRGSPIGHCGLCGYMPLYIHCTIKNKKTGEEINVGSECLAQLFGEQKGERLVRAIESIKRKVSSDYRRPIKQADINAWLQNLKSLEPTAKRNARIDSELAKYPHTYYPNMAAVPKEYRDAHPTDWSYVGYCKDMGLVYEAEKEKAFAAWFDSLPHDKTNNQQAIERQKAEAAERKDRGFWDYHIANFGSKDWAPQTMKSQYETQAKKDGLEAPKITWRALTEQERVDEHRLIDTAVNEWVEKITAPKRTTAHF